MPDFVITPVYRVEELVPSARKSARAWGRQHVVPDDCHECVVDHFEQICAIIGVDLAARPVRLHGGGTRRVPCVYVSAFASQGDGSSFEGSYRYAPRSAAKIRAYAPDDGELHRIADALVSIQRLNFYQLEASVRQQGRYCHEYTMAIRVERASPTGQAMTPTAEDDVTEALRDLARWLYRRLEGEFDYQTSDAEVDAAFHANDYTFTERGARFP